jgi:hypothetical protein
MLGLLYIANVGHEHHLREGEATKITSRTKPAGQLRLSAECEGRRCSKPAVRIARGSAMHMNRSRQKIYLTQVLE